MEDLLPKFPYSLEDLSSLETVGKITKEKFNQQFGFASKPVVLNELSRDWPALSKWTEDYFVEKFHFEEVTGERQVNNKSEYRKFTLDTYFKYAKGPIVGEPFYLNNSKFHLGTSMTNDYKVPEYFRCWYNEIPAEHRKHHLSWIYIGAKRTFSNLHLDIWNTSAWNCLIKGRKLWLFYMPEDEKYLYSGKVNPFHPDNAKFPKFKRARPIYCIQKPGDVVFTPSSWWHAVFNLENTISITENFINETNYKNVLDFFRSQNAKKSYSSMLRIVQKNISILNN